MPTGLTQTFQLLSTTENEAAVAVLIPALDSPHAWIREEALRAILERRSLAGETEIVRRWHTIDVRWRVVIDQHRGRMTQALRNAVLDRERQMCANGCEAALWFHEYDLLPALVNALEDEANPNAELVAATLLQLADLLYEELAAPRDYRNRRDPQLVRRHVTGSLELSAARYAKHKRKEIIEAFLLLTPRDNATLRQILSDPHHGSYLAVVDALLHSERGGVMRLILSYLDDTHPPSAALNTLVHRDGPKFIGYLLKKIGFAPSQTAAQNLKRIETIPWVRPEAGILTALDDAAQHSVVKLVMASGMKRQEIFRVVEHLLRRGHVAGRRAAAEALAEFSGSEANHLCLWTLDDQDPMVKATIIRQLRQRGIPGILPRLIELTNSASALVREAVRESLAEFRFTRFLAAFDMLDDSVRRSTGELVRKIDCDTVPLLLEELASPVRTRRLRAIAVAVATGVAFAVEDKLIELLADDDHLVRLESATALAGSNSEAACQALADAARDYSVLVQQAAQRSLAEMAQRGNTTARAFAPSAWEAQHG